MLRIVGSAGSGTGPAGVLVYEHAKMNKVREGICFGVSENGK